MMRRVLLALSALMGCSFAPEGVGLVGTPSSGDSETVVRNDIQSVSLRKGALVAKHDLIADSHCGGRCSFRRRAAAHLELHIDPQGVARVVDRGEEIEEFRSTVGETRHKLSWHRSWTGSWTEGRGEVVLTLQPEETRCERTPHDVSDSQEICHAVALVLSCEAGSITLHEPKNKIARAWVCRPRGRVLAGDGLTPFPWIFGVDYQVDTSDRMRGRHITRLFFGDPPADPKKPSSS